MTFLDDDDSTVTFSHEIGRGGEGVVYAVQSPPKYAGHRVAKIYLKPPDKEKVEKLRAMKKAGRDDLQKFAAWPVSLLRDPVSRSVRGFLMPAFMSHRDIHVVYGNRSRQKEFPSASYAFLVRVATNLSRAVNVVHEAGHVIGDLNDKFVSVSVKGTVTILDCDSFQISDGGRTFHCDVGVPQYQPPEIHAEQTFKGLVRTQQHDCFGLAVLIFQTLFFARHPFAGRPLGADADSLESAIQGFRYAYSRDAASRAVAPPPHTLNIGSVTPELRQLFEDAFLEKGASGGRPSAAKWVAALADFEKSLVQCKANGSHQFWRGVSSCPLCALESQSKSLLFVPPLAAHPQLRSQATIDQIWGSLQPEITAYKSLTQTQVPRSRPSVPVRVPDDVRAYATGLRRRRAFRWGVGAATLATLVAGSPIAVSLAGVLIASFFVLKPRPPATLINAESSLDALARERDQRAAKVASSKQVAQSAKWIEAISRVHEEMKRIEQDRPAKYREIEARAQERARQLFLESAELSNVKIRGLGPSTVSTLASWGIETATDVELERLFGIPGVGEARRAALLEWRADVERQFKPTSVAPIVARDRARLDQQIAVELAQHQTKFLDLAARLEKFLPDEKASLADAIALARAAESELAAAEAILAEVRR